MDRLVVTYHPATAFWAGRLVDRLTLRMGEDAITILGPDDRADIDRLTSLLAEHDALLVIVPERSDDDDPVEQVGVHLPMSVAIRRDQPITSVVLRPGAARGSEEVGASDGPAGIVTLELDPDDLDDAGARLIAHLERWLTAARVIPRIEFEETVVPAFVGITSRLPADVPGEERTPRLVTSWRQFEALYGGFTTGALLPLSVYGWFENGGRACYVAPVQQVESPNPGDSLDQGEPLEPTPDISWGDVSWVSQYVGSESRPTGIRGLVLLDAVTVLVLPDLVTVCVNDDGEVDLARWKAIQTAAISEAEIHDRIALLDSPPGLSPQQVREWREDVAMYDSRHAIMHYPWIKVWDPLGMSSAPLPMPASGHIAGVWARSDRERAVWRSPANQVIHGAVDAVVDLTANERYVVATAGVNPIRLLGRKGIRIWGSSTLSSDVWFASLEVSRLTSAIRRACAVGLRWAAFEPDSASTRSSVTRQVEAFLAGLWKAGALVGERQSDAFYVECVDDDRDEGVHVNVGIQPADGIGVRLAFGRRYGELGAVLG